MRSNPFPTLLLLALATTVGCTEDELKEEGADCLAAKECSTGHCIIEVCSRPEADIDGDGVTNALEEQLKLDIGSADTDGDGEADGREVGPAGLQGGQAFDCDGDGDADALERQVITPTSGGDADGDTIPDEWDDPTTTNCTDKELPEVESETAQGCRTYVCRPKTYCELKAEVENPEVRSHCADGSLSDRDETCDNIDDDCDGRLDEDCDGNCDGVDDDCDGLVDDDFGRPECSDDGRPCTAAQEALSARWDCTPTAPDQAACVGRRVCEDRVETCAVQYISALDRTCDGVDDDCAGGVDEDYRSQVCGFGVCRGETVCENGQQICPTDDESPVHPEDVCDGVDDDCDGTIDEGFVPADAPPCHAGACEAAPRCTLAGLECPPLAEGTPARDVTCDNVDDDCDGATDEEWPGDDPAPSCGDAACPGHASQCVAGDTVCSLGTASGGDAREHAANPEGDLVSYDLIRDGLDLSIRLSFDGDVPTDDPGVDPAISFVVCLDNEADAGDPAGCDVRFQRRFTDAWTCEALRWADDAWADDDAIDLTCEVELEELTFTVDLAGVSPGCGTLQIQTLLADAPLDGLVGPVDLP